MKTLDQIEKTVDLDARVIHAAALLEAELRSSKVGKSNPDGTLGDFVQQVSLFEEHSLTGDLNFALKIRNAIAHLAGGIEPQVDQKKRAAKYLLEAIRLIRQATGKGQDYQAIQSQTRDRFDRDASEAALRGIIASRRRTGAILGFTVAVGIVLLKFYIGDESLPMNVFLGAGVICGIYVFSFFFGSNINKQQYQSLPGAQFHNGDHRCIYCGHRGRNGRGIYTHGQYKSDAKFHKCSKCEKLLYTS